MITGRYFIVFGLQPWDFEMGSNCKDIAIELSKNNRVLYVNRPIERSSLIKFRKDEKIQNRLRSIHKGIDVLVEGQDNIWVFNPRVILESINWLPSGRVYHTISRSNAKKLAQQIQWAIDELDFRNCILLIDNDFLKGYYLNDFLKADTTIYYVRDFLQSQPYFARHGKIMEPLFMAKADVVVANSGYLANYAQQFNPMSFNIGQGCNLDGYLQNAYPIPEDMEPIKGIKIGYVGALLTTRLDIQLLEELARRGTDWNIVLVGPEDTGFKNSVLHSMDNVYFLGPKPAEKLPAYVHHFDICINPQTVNQMTIGNYPRKIDEYLAAGKLVVATNTQAMQMFKEHCFLASNTDQYIEGIAQLLSAPQSETAALEKIAFARSHTWEASVKEMSNAINIYQKTKQADAAKA